MAVDNAAKTHWRQNWYKWPEERNELGHYIESFADKFNVWYGVSLFSRPERKREFAVPGTRIWADLDEVEPFGLEAPPSITIESSPGRYQAIWSFNDPIPPDLAQEYSRKLAYTIGADKSGWDLEQLLRVPFTYNFKYDPASEVKLIDITGTKENLEYFENLKEVVDVGKDEVELVEPEPVPDISSLEDIYLKYDAVLTDPTTNDGLIFNDLVTHDPTEGEDWSARLWRLINFTLELGITPVDTFSVAFHAKCNKYARDQRPTSHLWKEVQKAVLKQKSFSINTNIGALKMPQMVDPDKVTEDSFVSEYKAWANEATDAPEQYHELSCFIALSSVVSQGLALELQYNSNFRPNLWGLLLGESTLSRKTTCMNMAMDIITDLDPELILASDGSAEGLLAGLSTRPKRVSIFFRDEVSGFFESINKKDYLAGFPEVLTKLYDVPKIYPRMLRKETITVIEPYFVFFGGGIRDKVYGLIDDDYILSGFIPRFLVVSSENDISRLRRTGPPTAMGTSKKDALVERLANLKEQYSVQVAMQVGTQSFDIDRRVDAELTRDAWEFFGNLEETVPLAAMNTAWEMLALPTFTRLTFSVLKMGMIIAATRREPTANSKLVVELSDLQQAAYYVQKWGKYSLELIMASGKSSVEKILDRVMHFINSDPNGITQSDLMRRFHLSSREMKDVRDTLADRGLIAINKKGRGLVLKAQNF